MAFILQEHQAKVSREFIAKEIKRHLRKFAKTTQNERTCFEDFLQDWLWSLDNNSQIARLYQAFRQLEGESHLIEVDY